MKIAPITSDEQWFRYIRRAEKTDEGVVALARLMLKTTTSCNWIWCLHTRGRKYKQNRLIRMIVLYYHGLTPQRRKECMNKFFVVSKGTLYGDDVFQ